MEEAGVDTVLKRLERAKSGKREIEILEEKLEQTDTRKTKLTEMIYKLENEVDPEVGKLQEKQRQMDDKAKDLRKTQEETNIKKTELEKRNQQLHELHQRTDDEKLELKERRERINAVPLEEQRNDQKEDLVKYNTALAQLDQQMCGDQKMELEKLNMELTELEQKKLQELEKLLEELEALPFADQVRLQNIKKELELGQQPEPEPEPEPEQQPEEYPGQQPGQQSEQHAREWSQLAKTWEEQLRAIAKREGTKIKLQEKLREQLKRLTSEVDSKIRQFKNSRVLEKLRKDLKKLTELGAQQKSQLEVLRKELEKLEELEVLHQERQQELREQQEAAEGEKTSEHAAAGVATKEKVGQAWGTLLDVTKARAALVVKVILTPPCIFH